MKCERTVIPDCELSWLDRFPRTLREAFSFAVDAVKQAALATFIASHAPEKGGKLFERTVLRVFDSNVALSRSLYGLGNEFSAVAPHIERFEKHVAPNVHALVHYVTYDKFRQTYNAVLNEAIPRDEWFFGELTHTDEAWKHGEDDEALDLLSGHPVPRKLQRESCCRPSLDVKKGQIAEHAPIATAAWLKRPMLSFENDEELRHRLEQELCRAYDRRLVAGRVCAYPEDSEEEDDTGIEAAQWDEVTEARNRWLYKQCCECVPYASIIRELKEKSEWDPIDSVSGVRRAANAYAERKGLPSIPRRQRGRPGK